MKKVVKINMSKNKAVASMRGKIITDIYFGNPERC